MVVVTVLPAAEAPSLSGWLFNVKVEGCALIVPSGAGGFVSNTADVGSELCVDCWNAELEVASPRPWPIEPDGGTAAVADLGMLWGCSLEEADVLGSRLVDSMPELRLIIATEDVAGDARPGAGSGMSVVVASLLTISGRNDIENIVELSLGPRFDELREGSPVDAVV